MAAKVRPPLPDGPFLVVGLARSGAAIAHALAGRGLEVRGADSGSPREAGPLRDQGIEIELGSDGVALLDGVQTVVKSPGVPAGAAVIVAARERGIDVVGELELGWRLVPGRFVAITGTNGKTTATEWVGHTLREAGRAVSVAGNVGTPISSLAGSAGEAGTVVCECSSFQLEDSIEFAPECAVLLNVSEDHLDRHTTLDRYRDAKLRIFANQLGDDVAIWDADEELISESLIGGAAQRAPFGSGCPIDSDGAEILVDGQHLVGIDELALPGAHNVRNAMAVAGACFAEGLAAEQVVAGLTGFPGVPHRLERVAELEGVLYVNDSKATNVAAAAAALRSFERPVRAILGGSLKGGGFSGLRSPVAERCAGVYLTGEASGALAEDLAGAGPEILLGEDLARAFAIAAEAAVPGDVVLLAPACASFDEFSDYEARGERFRELVRGLE